MRFSFSVVILLLSAAVTTSSLMAAAPGLDTNVFYSHPVLGRPTNTEITFTSVSKVIVEYYFEYGTIPGQYSQQTQPVIAQPEIPVRTTISGLTGNTGYYYRLRYRKNATGSFLSDDEHRFMTARMRGSSFKFALTADSHLYDKKGVASVMRLTMQNINNHAPDLIFDLGDTYGDDHQPLTTTQQEMMQLHKNFLPFIGISAHSSHFYFCLGNHEGENGYYLLQTPPNNLAVYGTLARKYYYSNPVPNSFYSGNSENEANGIGLPENYYAFEWGDALFVVLDVYRYAPASDKPNGWDWTVGQAQYDWFKSVLQTSSAKYKFVFAHHTRGQGRGGILTAKYFEWGGYEQNGTVYNFNVKRPGWGLPIHQLMVAYKVNVFFQGHDHLFAQEVLDSLVYQEVPMPADSTYTIGILANADAYVSNQLEGSGHLEVSLTPEFGKVEYVRTWLPADTNATRKNGEIAFSYTFRPALTGISKDEQNTLNVSLSQNAPNPFRDYTEFRYTLNKPDFVNITLYDLLGKEVQQLVAEYKPAGTYSCRFSSEHTGTYGNTRLAPGMYFYQLRTGSTVITKKTILVR